MDSDLAESLSRDCDVFRQLGGREPANLTEAQAVIENIRAEKGYLDDKTLQELNILDARTKERLLRIINLKRETEAAYTTRYAILLGVKLFTSSSKYFRITVLIKVLVFVRIDSKCRRLFIQQGLQRQGTAISAIQSHTGHPHRRDKPGWIQKSKYRGYMCNREEF
jgi:hypothetical protein